MKKLLLLLVFFGVSAVAMTYTEPPLIRAAWREDWAQIQALVVGGADINTKDSLGDTALVWAIRSNNEEMVTWLLEHGAKVNEKNDFGRTALHIATTRGNPQLVRILIEHGADIYATNNNGKTPYDIAGERIERRRNPEMFKIMQQEDLRRRTQSPIKGIVLPKDEQ